MLKIKDDVDLKELEKFGFVFENNIGKYKYRPNRNNMLTLFVRIGRYEILNILNEGSDK